MKPVLVQTLIKHRRKSQPIKDLDEKIYADTATPTAKIIFWALAAIIILSVAIA